jgi:hypothetical protein
MSEKCTIRDGSHVEPCVALSAACEGQKSGGKSRGVFVWPLWNIKTGEPSRTMYGAVTSNNPKGLIFNYCPWCGTDLTAANIHPKNGGANEN